MGVENDLRRIDLWLLMPQSNWEDARGGSIQLTGMIEWGQKSKPQKIPRVSNNTPKNTWGPFLESPGNFTGPKSYIQNEI